MNGTLTYNISQDRIRLFQCCVGGASHACKTRSLYRHGLNRNQVQVAEAEPVAPADNAE